MQLKEGNKDALKDLYQIYHQHLFNFGQKMTPDSQIVEDAIQDTFISLWKYRSSLSQPQSVKQYLFKAFRNHLFTLFKDRAKVTYTEDVIHFNFEVGFETKIIEGEDTRIIADQINMAIAQLTDRQREIIYFRFYENLSFDEISEVMNMQRRATYKLMSRALLSLKQILGRRSFLILLIFLADFILK